MSDFLSNNPFSIKEATRHQKSNFYHLLRWKLKPKLFPKVLPDLVNSCHSSIQKPAVSCNRHCIVFLLFNTIEIPFPLRFPMRFHMHSSFAIIAVVSSHLLSCVKEGGMVSIHVVITFIQDWWLAF